MPSKRKKKQAQQAKQAAQPASKGPQIRTIADNRRARFDYDIMERVEAGIVLAGTEIKSVRAARVTIRDAYAQIRGGQALLHNMHIAAWEGAGPWGHEPVRPRKLLMHAGEIARFGRAANERGLTLVPLRVYIKGHYAKVEIALAKGRRRYDKRQAIMRRDADREIARAIRGRA